jgi:hypothetical protein
MKIRALKSFEGIRDNERNVYPKEGDVWEVNEERANFLKKHGVIEFVEEEKEIDITENEFEIRSEEVKELVDEKIQEVEEIKEKQPKPNKKKKSSKK